MRVIERLYQRINNQNVEIPLPRNNIGDGEITIGSWFGSPLYRRTKNNLVFPSLNTNGVMILDLGSTGVTVTKLECISTLKDGRSFVLPYHESMSCHLFVQNGKIYAYANSTLFNSAKSQLVVEYSKG